MHTEIKTYSLVDNKSKPLHFKLKSIEQIIKNMNGIVDSPHRHDYYTIILVRQGGGMHFVDFREYEITGNSVFFVSPGQVHQVVPHTNTKGWVITFSNEFLMQNNISQKLINDVYLYNDYGESPPLPLHEHEVENYYQIIKQINDFDDDASIYANEARGALLKLFLIKSYGLCTMSKNINLQSTEPTNPLFRKFKDLIESNYSQKHKVNDYADMLAVTSDYLNKVVKSLSGKTAKDYIQSKIMIEAKRSLLFTDLTNKELAFQLGFEEPAHFSNFFRKNSGTSPIDFREKSRLI